MALASDFWQMMVCLIAFLMICLSLKAVTYCYYYIIDLPQPITTNSCTATPRRVES